MIDMALLHTVVGHRQAAQQRRYVQQARVAQDKAKARRDAEVRASQCSAVVSPGFVKRVQPSRCARGATTVASSCVRCGHMNLAPVACTVLYCNTTRALAVVHRCRRVLDWS